MVINLCPKCYRKLRARGKYAHFVFIVLLQHIKEKKFCMYMDEVYRPNKSNIVIEKMIEEKLFKATRNYDGTIFSLSLNKRKIYYHEEQDSYCLMKQKTHFIPSLRRLRRIKKKLVIK